MSLSTSEYRLSLEPSHYDGATGAEVLEWGDNDELTDRQRSFRDWAARHWHDGLLAADAPIAELSEHLGHLHKIEITADGDDFVYRIYGERVSNAANLQMAKKRVSELGEPVRSAMLAHYRDLASNPRLFFGSLVYSGAVKRFSRWIRAIAPFGRDGKANGFIVLTYPDPDS